MKNYGLLLLILLLWCSIVPALVSGKADSNVNAAEVASLDVESSEVSSPENNASVPESDVMLKIYIEETNTQMLMSVEDYVACALSAVMPDDSPVEALKAQAIAIRSVALHNLEFPRHEGYDLCGNHLHCSPVADTPRADCIAAVAETAGEVLCYDSAPALALSHLSSCICTESYDEGYPYLVSVPVKDEKDFLCYKTVYSFSTSEFKAAFSAYAVDFSDNTEEWIENFTFTDGNRVKTVKIGGVNFKGSTVASLLKTDSLCFTVNSYSDRIEIICYGSGSGVGMSRCSAILMAKEGVIYVDILKYFYPGTVLKTN